MGDNVGSDPTRSFPSRFGRLLEAAGDPEPVCARRRRPPPLPGLQPSEARPSAAAFQDVLCIGCAV